VSKVPNAHEKFIEITEAYEFLIEHRHEFNADYEYNQSYTEDHRREAYARFQEEARKRAEAQAKMRYETFRKQHEAFQQSGLNDLGLIFTLIFRFIVIPVTIGFLLLPLVLPIIYGDFKIIFTAFFFWPFAFGLSWYIYDNRKTYWTPGKFYYNFQRIKQTFTETTPSQQPCHYCSSQPANSKPYKLELLKLKDIKLKSYGPRQHSMNYVNDKAIIQIPRSQKAFIIHTSNIIVKILSIVSCLVFLTITSFVWRFIAGMTLGGIVSTIILLVTNTKSNVSYLWSLGMILRVCGWLFLIFLCSSFSFHPFDVTTSEYIQLIVIAIIFFDCFLMQLVKLVFGKYSYKPIIRQYKDVDLQFNNGYKVYNDVFVVSVIYPLFLWIFG
jgi:hypothetical protein